LAAWERTSNGSFGIVDGELGKGLGSNMKSRDSGFAVWDMPICRRWHPHQAPSCLASTPELEGPLPANSLPHP